MGLKPRMQITERVDGQPTQATCTACPDVTFHAGPKIGTDEDGQLKLQLLFDHHFLTVHGKEEPNRQ